MTILVTGARGAIGSALLARLAEAGADVRAASSTPRPDRVLLNLHDPDTFAAALRGVSQVFLYANEATAAEFARAADTAGVRHVVLLSSNAVTAVVDPGVNPMSASFLAAETALAAGPVPVTLLRPGSFASNAKQWMHGIRGGRAVDLPYPDARVDAVVEADVVEVAHRVLTDPALLGVTLNLTGPAAISHGEQIAVIADRLGEDIEVRRITRDRWAESAGPYLSDAYAQALLDYWQGLTERPADISPAVADVTGRPATPFHTWVDRNIDLFR